jgi:hypothetical protein
MLQVSGAEPSDEHWRPKTQTLGAASFRHFKIAGLTVRVESDIDLNSVAFKDEFAPFVANGPGTDNLVLRHHFDIPRINARDLGTILYRKAPWIISSNDGRWFYRGVSSEGDDPELHRLAVFNQAHTDGTIYSPPGYVDRLKSVGWHSLSLLPTDQIWLAAALADRQAIMLHSGAVILNGCGLLFVGHSSAGKSTTMMMLKNRAEILCDDRNVARRWDDGWRVHGTWSHGDVADVSPASAPLHAILFIEQSTENEIIPMTDRKLLWRRLLATLIRPVVTAYWWQKELAVIENIVNEVPCYAMRFDKSGAIVPKLEELTRARSPISQVFKRGTANE